MTLTALALNCTLKPSAEGSSTQILLDQVLAAFAEQGVSGRSVHMASLNIKPGVLSDEGEGDEWPGVRRQILDSDILILGTPIWMGQPSSVCKRVLERMDAFLSETDNEGRMVSYGRVAGVATVGNEDGAHHVSAELFQALNDVGFSLAANAVTYWVGEAMHGTDYKDLDGVPDVVATATGGLVRNAVHMASLLRQSPYPPAG